MAFLSKYAVARNITIPIIKRGVVDFAVSGDWTPAAGDVKISIDNGAAANVTNLPTAIAMGNGAVWEFQLTSGELTGKLILVTVVDAATKAVEDQSFVIETYGNASAQHAFDLGTALQSVNTTQLAGQTVTAGAGVTFPGSVASPTNITAGTITTVTNLTNAPTSGDFTATMKTSIGTAVAASAVASVTGSVGSVTGLTASNLDVAVSSRMASYTQPAGFLAATFPSGTIANQTNITAGTLTTATNLTNAPTAGDFTATMKTSLATAITALLTTQMTESYSADGAAPTPAQAFCLMLALLGEFAISGTTLQTKKLDGATAAAQYTLDSSTNPTTITRSA